MLRHRSAMFAWNQSSILGK